MAFTLFLTPLFIRLFNKLGWGQFIRDDGPQSHHAKRGTPTMGGIVFIIGALVGYFVGHLVTRQPFTLVAFLVMFMMVGLGFVGFIDDFLKTRKQRSLGLGGWAKICGQVIVATIFAFIAFNFPDENDLTGAGRVLRTEGGEFSGYEVMVSAVRDIPWLNLFFAGSIVGVILFILWVNIIAVSASNGVNVADGLDGLATGASILALTAYIVIGF